MRLESLNGSIQTLGPGGDIWTFSNTGAGNIDLLAAGDVLVGDLFAYSFGGNGGAVTITAGGPAGITVTRAIESFGPLSSGDITLDASSVSVEQRDRSYIEESH